MGSKRTAWLIGISVVLLLLLSCDAWAAPRGRGWGPGRGFGPPAHAPAYGHRNKVVYGYTLIFEPGFALYLVVGLTDCYYHEGRFYRWRGGVWEISLRADKWEPIGRDKMPTALQLKAKSVAKYNSPGPDPAKPTGDIKATGNAKPNTGGAKLNANEPAPPNGAGSAAIKPNAGSAAKPAGAGDAEPKATAGSPTKSGNAGATRPSGKSGTSGKARSSSKGRR